MKLNDIQLLPKRADGAAQTNLIFQVSILILHNPIRKFYVGKHLNYQETKTN
jgi:hypothetical protein